jgi:hypothetical protein
LLYGRLRQLRRTAGTHAMLFLFAESPFYFTWLCLETYLRLCF